ncbi:hypothetical protein C8R46DRAFT_937682 [Mycena filopes]|nr:hypothetical protein C8R46DRAFT_937682 [Mycena filopes]
MSTTPESPPDSTAPPTTDAHTSVEGLWFNDGTLVLQAGTAAFRVYGGFLAERSPVFHDMLQFPQPEGGHRIEGCPVVELSDDKHDLEYFLRALFDHEFFPPYPAKTDFNVMSGIIRLSTKYQVDTLRKRGLVHLSSAFPTDISQYSRWPETASWHIVELPEWIRVVLFGQELSLDWILPIAFYRVAANCSAVPLLTGINVPDVGHFELNAADKLLCVDQSSLLGTLAFSDIIDFLWEPTVLPGCQSSEKLKCTHARFKARKEIEAQRLETFPLRAWEAEHWERLSSSCGSCMSSMKTIHAAARQSLWDGLPQRFGLADWAALEQIKAAALA